MTSTSTSTTSTSTSSPLISITKNDPLPDHYYFSDHDDPIDYYDNVDEISIPSSSIKPFNNKKNYSSSSIQTSSSSLSQSTAQAVVRINDQQYNRLQYKLPEYSEYRYDQSTLKSFFMSSPTTESRIRSTTTEKPTSIVVVPSTTTARDFEVQRQKILSFIVSENQPSSFKAPSSTTQKPLVFATNKEINSKNNYYKAFVNTQESTTTISHPNTTSTNSPRSQNKINQSPTKTTILLSRDQLAQNKTIRLTLSSTLGSLNPFKSHQSSSNQYNQGSVEEIPLIRSRQPETRQSLHLKPIEPTTYSPQKPFRTSTETTEKPETTTVTMTTTLSPTSILLEDDAEELEPHIIHSRRRPYVNDFLTNSNNIPTRFPPRSTTTEIPVDVSEFTTLAPTSSTTFRSVIQTFTSRGLVFKENLNRTFEPQNLKPIVSPYISLETQRLTNAIRTTTPRPNEYTSKATTSTSLPLTSSTYRSYFLITAPIKDKSSIPSTYLFPETSSPSSTSLLTTTSTTPVPSTIKPAPFSISTESSYTSTENSRGRYRPFVTFTSQNSIDEEPTTYSPRLRYNTRTQTMVDSVSSSLPPTDQPVVRRKVVRLKTASNKSIDTFNPSTDLNRIDVTTSTPLRIVSEKFVASPSRETSQFRPIASKPNDFVSKLSYSSDSPNSAALRQSSNTFNQLPKVNELHKTPSLETGDKPFFYIRFKNSSLNLDPLETSTKKFRATVEMPEMNVPTEKDLHAFVDTENEEVYDEEENDHQNSSGSLDIIVNDYRGNRGEHEVDNAYKDKFLRSTTVAPSTYHKIQFNTTYSTVSETSTSTYQPTMTSTLTSTSLRTTEKEPTTTTANPKSLIPPRTSRVNNAIKTSIVAGLPRRNSASIKCNDISANAKCNEIPSRYYT